ncbi:hypothetical protein STEG23_004059, partial [Scotinomys teguina]
MPSSLHCLGKVNSEQSSSGQWRCRHMAHGLRLYLVPLHGDLLHGRLASFLPLLLALDSSSSFPCPAFLAMAKSPVVAYTEHSR